MNTTMASEFLKRCFGPEETIAVLLRREEPNRIVQRIVRMEQATASGYLRWLAHQNASGMNVYVAANPLRSGSRRRTKECIAEVRHLYLDIDREGDARLAALRSSDAVPERYYAPLYLRTAILGSVSPRHRSTYRMMFVGGGHLAPRPAMPADVAEGATPQLDGRTIPFALSSSARQYGYTLLFRGPIRSYVDSGLSAYLMAIVFGGKSIAGLYKPSILGGAIVFVILLPFAALKDVRRQKQLKYGRRLKGPEMLTAREFNKTVRGDGTLRSPSAQARIEFRPSGRFAFIIREYLYARQEPTFFDRPERPLEGQLSVILHGLRTAALDLRETAERQAKEREAEEKLADQHRLAEVQFRKLDETLENWTKAEMLHRLIAHIERKMESQTPADPSYAYRWLHWARTVATSLDPTSGSLDDFFQHYRKLGPPKSPGDLE